ncbi:hypothetical protein BX600DRAFT_436449 [Xylariales sp. PMI_506]|nr:hypothetical protein BX600DRAFT_436449 [Xylariales sp. PMI_506]
MADSDGLDHSRRGWVVIVTGVVCMVLATAAVSMRMYTRLVMLKSAWIDDYLSVFALSIFIAQTIFVCYQTGHGLGTHLYDLTDPNALTEYFKDSFIALMIYSISLLAIKFMYFFQYYRIVRKNRTWRIIYCVTMSIVTGWAVSQIFVNAFSCIPIQAVWDHTIQGTCEPLSPHTMSTISSAGNIITDVIILVLPIPMVMKLKTSSAQKWTLVGLFSLGFFTCIISSLRLILVPSETDFTFDGIQITTWSTAEQASGLLCAAIPTLRPLAGRFIPRFATSNQSTRGYMQYGSGSKHQRGKVSSIRITTTIQSKMGVADSPDSSSKEVPKESWEFSNLEMVPLRTPRHAHLPRRYPSVQISAWGEKDSLES